MSRRQSTRVFARRFDNAFAVAKLRFTPDGSRIVTLDESRPNSTNAGDRVRIWNADDGELIRELSYHRAFDFALSHDNHLLAIVTSVANERQQRYILIYDLDHLSQQGEDAPIVPIFTFVLDTRRFQTIVFTPNRQLLLDFDTGDIRRIVLFPTLPSMQQQNVTDVLRVNRREFGDDVRVSSNGAYFVVGPQTADTGVFRVLQTATSTYINVPTPNVNDVRDQRMLPQIGNNGWLLFEDDGSMESYQLVNGAYVRASEFVIRSLGPDITLSPSGLLYGYLLDRHAPTLKVRRTLDSTLVCDYYSPLFKFDNEFTMTDDDASIILYTDTRRQLLIDIATQQLVKEFPDGVTNVRVSPTNPIHVAGVDELNSALVSYDLSNREAVRGIAQELVSAQQRAGDQQQMRHGVGSIILSYLGLSRLVDDATFVAPPPQLPVSKLKRKERE